MNNLEMESNVLLSIISPVYRAEEIVEELVKRIINEVSIITPFFEIVLVEDGSPDRSWDKVLLECKKDNRVKGVKLSRNFGQHYAVTAGLSVAQGKAIVLMDCDLQDDPAHIRKLYAKHIDEGFDVVFTTRIKRKHSFFKSVTSKAYNLLFSFFSNKDFDVEVGSLTLMSYRVKDEFLRLKDKDRLYIQLIKWVGFKQTYLPVAHEERFKGKSTYSISKLFFIAIQGWTSHSNKLLHLSVYTGFALSGLTFLIGIYILILFFTQGFMPGWPSLFIAILFSTGLILMSIGIAGIYIGKIFEQTKDRPLFIIDQKINF